MSTALILRRMSGKPHERSAEGRRAIARPCSTAAGPTIRRQCKPLLTLLARSMLQVIRRVLGARHPHVEDTLQEAMLATARALLTFRGECSARHLGSRIATFVAIGARRRQMPPPSDSLNDHDRPGDPKRTGRWLPAAS